MIAINIIQKILNPLSLSISDKHLSEIIVADQFHQLRHPIVVQLVENVIQKQNRLEAYLLIVEIELRKLDGDHKRLLLSLRAESLNLMIINQKTQIIFMNADVGI